MRCTIGLVVALWAGMAGADVTVSISQPASGAAVGDSLAVTAMVTSPYTITGVQAQVGAVHPALTPGTAGSNSGTLDISSIATGPTTLTVTATDMMGGIGSAQVTFAHDHPPVLAVANPLPGTVARPMLHASASCSDTDAYGCASLAVHLGSDTGMVLATTSASTLDQMIALDAYEGQQIALFVVATDSAGMTASSGAIAIYVDSSPRLLEVQSVPAPIVDVDSTRILYGTTIRTRGTTSDTVLSSVGTECRLSPKGALCNGGEWNTGSPVATWPSSVDFSGADPGFAARGNSAAWVASVPADGYTAYYRDSVAGTTTTVLDNGSYLIYAEDVAANGDAIFIRQEDVSYYNVYRYRAGILTALTTGNAKWQVARTDGTNVVYQRWYLGYFGGTHLYTDAGEIILVPDTTCTNANAYLSYAVNGGWTAYGSPDGSCAVVQVWVRAPDDTRTQLSIWSTHTFVDTVNDSGQVMMLNTSSLGSYRYLASPGVLPARISSRLGHALWLDAQWYVVMGRTLFSVGPEPPDGGVAGSDGGTPLPDAGSDGSMSTPPPPPDAATIVDAAVPIPDAGTFPPNAAMPGGGTGGQPPHDRGCAVAFGAPPPWGGLIVAAVVLLRRARRKKRGSIRSA